MGSRLRAMDEFDCFMVRKYECDAHMGSIVFVSERFNFYRTYICNYLSVLQDSVNRSLRSGRLLFARHLLSIERYMISVAK